MRLIRLVQNLPPARLLLLALLGGCSIYYETKRPDFTNVNEIKQGTPRYDVAGVMGRPLMSYTQDGKDVDVFQADPDGRYKGTKAAVTSFNAVADVLTIGMWEAVATPAEMLTQHKLTTYVVTYGPDERVESIRATTKEPKQLQTDASDATAPSTAGAIQAKVSPKAPITSASNSMAHPAASSPKPKVAAPSSDPT